MLVGSCNNMKLCSIEQAHSGVRIAWFARKLSDIEHRKTFLHRMAKCTGFWHRRTHIPIHDWVCWTKYIINICRKLTPKWFFSEDMWYSNTLSRWHSYHDICVMKTPSMHFRGSNELDPICVLNWNGMNQVDTACVYDRRIVAFVHGSWKHVGYEITDNFPPWNEIEHMMLWDIACFEIFGQIHAEYALQIENYLRLCLSICRSAQNVTERENFQHASMGASCFH